MTDSIFEDYLQNWDRQFNKKKKKYISSRQLLGTSKAELGENKITFFLSPNSTTHIQPPDQVTIKKTFKMFYRLDMRQRIIKSVCNIMETSSNHSIQVLVLDVLQTMNAWDKVSATCINSCFKNFNSVCCNIFQKDHNTDHIRKPNNMCEQVFNDWADTDHHLPVSTYKLSSV
jgi:hypothetical protein